jgi:hypothetical protein
MRLHGVAGPEIARDIGKTGSCSISSQFRFIVAISLADDDEKNSRSPIGFGTMRDLLE